MDIDPHSSHERSLLNESKIFENTIFTLTEASNLRNVDEHSDAELIPDADRCSHPENPDCSQAAQNLSPRKILCDLGENFETRDDINNLMLEPDTADTSGMIEMNVLGGNSSNDEFPCEIVPECPLSVISSCTAQNSAVSKNQLEIRCGDAVTHSSNMDDASYSAKACVEDISDSDETHQSVYVSKLNSDDGLLIIADKENYPDDSRYQYEIPTSQVGNDPIIFNPFLKLFAINIL